MNERRMKRTPRHNPDPLETQIELTLSPGAFIRDRACFSFVGGIEGVVAQIDELQKTDSARAAGLYETYLAGCHEKAEELDDSNGSFGQFAKDLICRWIKARHASGADPDETAARLLGWMDNDPYAFCYQIEREVAKAFDEAGLAAFERLIRARLETAPSEPEYDEDSGPSGARCLPSAHIAPHRVRHDLTSSQKRILQVLGARLWRSTYCGRPDGGGPGIWRCPSAF